MHASEVELTPRAGSPARPKQPSRVNVWFDLFAGFVLFVIFERKRFPGWRDKYLLMRARAVEARTGRALAAHLATAGFFENLSDQESRDVRTAIEKRGYSGVFDHPWRVLDADDEELAEGQVGTYLRLWAPSLERLGVAPLMGESRFVDGGAHVLDLPRETLIAATTLTRFLLTPAMLAAIMATPGVRRDELPYTRTVQWPYFGMDTSSALS